MFHSFAFKRAAKPIVSGVLCASLVLFQAAPGVFASYGENPLGTGLAFAESDTDTCELTLVHGTERSEFTSFDTLLDAASDGDTIELEADASLTAPISTAKSLTLDLKGHTLSSALAASGKSGAISFSGSGTFTLTSSISGGTLSVTVGSSKETSGTAGAYCGVSVSGGGTFELESATLKVAYTGSSTSSNLPTPALYGVYVSSGSAVLSDSASLTASATENDASTYGANRVEGIYTTASSESAKVDVSSDSTVEAVNNATCVSRGRWQTVDTTSNDTTYSASNLVQIFPDENSDFYKEICEKFKEEAKFDDSEEASATNSSSNDTEIYYATPLVLDSGVAVWVYSDPQTTDTRGKLDSIVPKYFFVQSGYSIATEAVGIASSSRFSGNVEVSGHVNATCARGDAYALDAQGASTWTADESADLSEEHGSDAITVKYGTLNLKLYINPDSTGEIATPGNDSSSVVYSKTPTGGAAHVSESSEVTVGGSQLEATDDTVDMKGNGVTVDDEGAAELWGTPQISVSFTGLKNGDGTDAEDPAAAEVTLGKTLSEAGVELPSTAESYTQDGATYRFVGWQCGGVKFDASALKDEIRINTDISGVEQNKAAQFSAVYVEVKSGQHLVRFDTDGRILAYAADDGAKASYEAAGGEVDPTTGKDDPSKIDEEKGYEYEFEAWQQDGKTLDELPTVTSDMTFTPLFKKTAKEIEVTFRYRNEDGSWTVTEGLTSSYNADTNALARNYASSGTVVKTSEKVYTFTGWGPRLTDQEAYWQDGTLPAVADSSSFESGKNIYYGKYTEQDRTLTVTFVVDGKQYAKTNGAVKTTMDFNDVLTSCGVSNPKDKSKKLRFLGWSTKENATTPDIARVNAAKLSAVAPTSGDELTLYAVFGDDSSDGVTRSDIKVKMDKRAKSELSVDVSKAHITAEDLDEAKKLRLTISTVSTADSVIRNKAVRMGYEPLLDANKNKAIYEVHLTYELNGKTIEVYDNFGTIKITAKVRKGAREDKTRSYWLGSSGINYSAVSENAAKLSFKITSLGYVEDGTGNLEIALKATDNAASTVKVNTEKPTPPTATPTAVKPTVPKSSNATKPSPVAASQGTTGTGTPTGTSVGNTGESAGGTDNDTGIGNLIGFAAVLALFAALAARIVWFFIKRQRKDAPEDETDPLPDKEPVSF